MFLCFFIAFYTYTFPQGTKLEDELLEKFKTATEYYVQGEYKKADETIHEIWMRFCVLFEKTEKAIWEYELVPYLVMLRAAINEKVNKPYKALLGYEVLMRHFEGMGRED